MKTFTLPLSFLFDDSLRIIRRYRIDNKHPIICRPVGPCAHRAYMAIVTRSMFPTGFGNHPIKDALAFVIPQDFIEALEQPENFEEVFHANAEVLFGNFISLWWNPFVPEMRCFMCRLRAMKMLAMGTSTRGGKIPPKVTFSPKIEERLPLATSVCFSNLWGTVCVTATCNRHYSKNHGQYLGDFLL